MKTNAKDVAGRLGNAMRKIPKEISTALSPSRRILFSFVAEKAMEFAAESDSERAAIPRILASIFGTKTQDGVRFGATAMSAGAIEDENPNDPFQDIPSQELIDWVANFKQKDERDKIKTGPRAGEFKSDAEIATRVAFAIKSNPEPWLSTSSTGRGALNPTGLAQIASISGLGSESTSRLLMAVARAWAQYAREFFPDVISIRIRAAFNQ